MVRMGMGQYDCVDPVDPIGQKLRPQVRPGIDENCRTISCLDDDA